MGEQSRRRGSRFGERRRPIFDVCFGIAVPIVCVLLDPLVFRSGRLLGEPLYGRFQVAAYLFMATQIGFLAAGLLLPPRGLAAAFLGSGLLIGGLWSLALGVLLAPWALLGLIALIGILGFAPLLTSLVYLRNAARHLRRAHVFRPASVAAIVLAVLVTAGLPTSAYLVGRFAMDRALATLDQGGPGSVAEAVDDLEAHRPLVYLDDLVHAYDDAKDDTRRARIAEAYSQLTSNDAEVRSRVLKGD